MLYIQKRTEPRELTQAKRLGLSHYDDMTTDVKDVVRHSLAEEQGYICAYCMKRIDLQTMQIEHYRAQNAPSGTYDAASTVDYGNMLGVCPGNKNSGLPHNGLTCDQHRGNTPLTVDPLKKWTIDQISYTSDGKIFSQDERINHDLDVILNLNCVQAYLPKGRKDALDSLKNKIHRDCAGGTANKAYLQKLHHDISQMTDGKLVPYLGILLDYLHKRMQRAER